MKIRQNRKNNLKKTKIYLLNGKAMIIHLIVGLTKNESFSTHTNKKKTEVEIELPNYAIKSDLINAKCVDTSQFAKKNDLAHLTPEVDIGLKIRS